MTNFFENAKVYYRNLEEKLTAKLITRESTQEVVITMGGIAIVMLVILLVSFTKPVTEQLNQTLFVEHYGSF